VLAVSFIRATSQGFWSHGCLERPAQLRVPRVTPADLHWPMAVRGSWCMYRRAILIAARPSPALW